MTPEEIVKRLRARRESFVEFNESGMTAGGTRPDADCNAAADLIERQAKTLEEVEKALLKFAVEAEKYEPDEGDDDQRIWGETQITIGHLRRARSALATIRAARGEKKDG